MDKETDKVAVVIGAQGVIGRNLVRYLEESGDWEVVGVSRRAAAPSSERVRHISVDLLDRRDTERKLGGLLNATHIFYAAYQDRPTWSELVGPNVAMLTNAVTAIEAAA